MDTKDKIRTLFYSDKEENRALAFELAKGAGCYEEMVEEFYEALDELPDFVNERVYYDEELKETNAPIPEGAELKQAYIDRFTSYLFYKDVDLNRRWKNDKKELKLKTIPKVLLNCDFITKLDLSFNDIEVIPEDIVKLKNLSSIDFTCNYNLKSLPDVLGKLERLEELSFYGIQGVFSIRLHKNEDPKLDDYRYELPLCIRSMKNLKHLNLGDVILSEFPEWINELENLRVLAIFSGWGSHPCLKLPKTFTKLPNLKSLIIGSYSVEIPDSIDEMQSLEHLSIDPAECVPSTIKNLKNLKTLDLSYLSSDYKLNTLEGYNQLWDLYNKGIPEGMSRIHIYEWEWLKEMTWLERFRFAHIEPYAFTDLEKAELKEALPKCTFVFED